MLEVRNVSVSYGRHRALAGTSLKVDKGEICVILGANGAGKSTLLKVIGGMVKSESGSVIMNGKDITHLKAHQIVEEGIALVPEGRGIFGDLTVAENLQLGAFANRARASETATLADIYRLFPRLAERKTQIARTMSGGEQQMVAIGRALMSKPEILMLDEPSLGLSPLLSLELFRALAEVAKTGVGILLVEQNARQSLKIAQRGYLIENGLVTGENTAAALMTDPAVVSAYLGGAKGGTAPAPKSEGPKPRFNLPAALRLPLSVEALGRAVSALAARAGRIQWAFVRALRREDPAPSAFVGRYDPKSIPDPWNEIAAEEASRPAINFASTPSVANDARRLGDSASDFALRASERLARHISTNRLSTPRPSAFVTSLLPKAEAEIKAEPEPEPAKAPEPVKEPAPAQKLEVKETEAPVPVVLVPVEEPQAPVSLIGHNSGGLPIDEEETPVVEAAPEPAPAPVVEQPSPKASTVADITARAAARQSAHIAKRRSAMPRFVPAPEGQSTWFYQEKPRPAVDAGERKPAPVPARFRPDAKAFAFGDMVQRANGMQAAFIARKAGREPVWQPSEPRKIDAPAAVNTTLTHAEPRVLGEDTSGDPIADLVSRAASIQAAHVAKNRKGLTAYTIPTQPSLRPATRETDPARGETH